MRRAIAGFVLALAGLPGWAWAQAPARPAAAQAADLPEPAPFYPASDPARATKLTVERLLGLYFVNPPWRHASEGVEILGREIKVHYWRSIAGDAEGVACDALRWLSSGRHQWASGAAGVFDELEGVERITLLFVNVERRRKGQVPGARDFRRYLQATVQRAKVAAIAPDAVAEVLDSGKCSEFLRKNLEYFFFDGYYFDRELARGLGQR
jgi:hypothetical protein